MVRKQSASWGEAANMFEDDQDFDSIYTNSPANLLVDYTGDDVERADAEPEDDDVNGDEDPATATEGGDHAPRDQEAGSSTPEMIAGYRVHPAASVFPMMEGKEFEDFMNSIRNNGQHDPVDVQGDVLIEGRNRAKAVELLRQEGVDIALQTREWQPEPGQTVAEYVADKNLHRRSLTDEQRAQIAAELVPMIEKERAEAQKASRIRPGETRNRTGTNQYSKKRKAEAEPLSPSAKRAKNKTKAERSTAGRLAKVANVSEHRAKQALKVQKQGSPEDIEAVKAGKKKARDVLAAGQGASKNTKPKPKKEIDHPYAPSDDFERDVLRWWIRLVEKELSVAEKARGREVMRAVFKAEEEAERRKPAGAKGGAR
ncbi:MAG: hypothetical protein ACKO1M_01050 [Planctomycetota bacterium]